MIISCSEQRTALTSILTSLGVQHELQLELGQYFFFKDAMRCRCCLWWTFLHDLAAWAQWVYILVHHSTTWSWIIIVWLIKNNWLKSALVSWVPECEYNLHVYCTYQISYDILCNSSRATCFMKLLDIVNEVVYSTVPGP